MVSEQSVNNQCVGCRNKDLNDFGKAQLLWQGGWVRVSLKRQGFWVASCQQWWEFTNSGQRRDKTQTGDRVLGAQGSSMHEGNECFPIWSKPTEGLLWRKSHKILMVFMGGMCHNTQFITLCCIWLHSCRPIRLPMMTPVHHRKHLQWACERQNWTLEQWKVVIWSDEFRFLLHHVEGCFNKYWRFYSCVEDLFLHLCNIASNVPVCSHSDVWRVFIFCYALCF